MMEWKTIYDELMLAVQLISTIEQIKLLNNDEKLLLLSNVKSLPLFINALCYVIKHHNNENNNNNQNNNEWVSKIFKIIEQESETFGKEYLLNETMKQITNQLTMANILGKL